jgi:nucleotide-binding universal stress UspA family protein
MDDGDAQTVLASAATLADRYGAALQALVCVSPPNDLSIAARLSGRQPAALIAQMADQARTAARTSLAKALPGRAIELHVAVGKAYLEIIRHVAETGCDFVVKQAEPLSGLQRFLFASTDQHLLRKCPCPVWLQTQGARTAPRRVLAAVDLDLQDAAEPETLAVLNRRVVEAARAVATAPDAAVVVLHAWEAMGEGLVWAFSDGGDARIAADRYVNEILETRRRAMDRLIAELETGGEAGAARLEAHLARGTPERVLRDQTRQLGVDVVVMGTVARTGLSGVFIGNTAENIINSLDCPVVAVKPDGFVSPLLRDWGGNDMS